MCLLLSCAEQGPRPVVRAAPVERRPAVTSEAVAEPAGRLAEPAEPVDTRPPCEVLGELSEAGRRSFPSELPAPDAAPCLEGKGGAYGAALSYTEDASSVYGPGWHGRLVLLHVDGAGRVARSRPLNVASTGTYATTYKLQGLADYDRDGTDELLVSVSDWEFEGNGDYHAEIWQVAGKGVEPYGPAATLPIARLEDVDGDGMPEAIVRTPFQGTINDCGPDGTYIEFGPRWAMHAGAKGEFSFDEVSRAELFRGCPKRPLPLVPRVGGGVDNTKLRERLACAVAWGVSSRTIERELARDCPKLNALSDECSYEGVLPVCVNVPQLVKWSTVEPPFKL